MSPFTKKKIVCQFFPIISCNCTKHNFNDQIENWIVKLIQNPPPQKKKKKKIMDENLLRFFFN